MNGVTITRAVIALVCVLVGGLGLALALYKPERATAQSAAVSALLVLAAIGNVLGPWQ